jgi:hypothetical protein
LLDDDIADSPETALPVVHELITRMLRERGVLARASSSRRAPTRTGSAPGTPAGRELAALVDDPDVDVDRQDVVDQLEEYQALFEALLAERAAP